MCSVRTVNISTTTESTNSGSSGTTSTALVGATVASGSPEMHTYDPTPAISELVLNSKHARDMQERVARSGGMTEAEARRASETITVTVLLAGEPGAGKTELRVMCPMVIHDPYEKSLFGLFC